MTTTSTKPIKQEQEPEEELPRMSFGDHLDELRKRLIWSILAMLAGVIVVTPFKAEVTDIYVAPYHRMWDSAYADFVEYQREQLARNEAGEIQPPLMEKELEQIRWSLENSEEILSGNFPERAQNQLHNWTGFGIPRSLKALGGLDDFWVFMAATLLFGLIIALPVVLYQVWAFIAAGLYRHERRVVMRLFPAALGLATIGVLFGYFAVVPTGLMFLTRLMDFSNVEPMFGVSQYFSFLLTLTAALGVVFQLPLVMLAVQKVGLMSHASMKKNWRFVILGFFIVSAMVTPPDPMTMIMMAIPMIVLFVIGLLLTARVEARQVAEES